MRERGTRVLLRATTSLSIHPTSTSSRFILSSATTTPSSRLLSTSSWLGGRSTSLASPLATTREGFQALLPSILADLASEPAMAELAPHIGAHLEAAVTYNLRGGKMNRGLSVPVSYQVLVPAAAAQELHLAALLGWTVEFLQAFYLVADDIMDGSETRRGQPCWFRRPEVGMIAFNDSIVLETCVYSILRQHFRGLACYTGLLEDLLEASRLTALGQAIDLNTAADYTRVRGAEGSLKPFTMERYSSIVKYKTSHYSFVLPVALALRLAGAGGEVERRAAAGLLLAIGHYFQATDDWLDCYGDPAVTGKVGTDIQDGKCSWLVAAALEAASAGQRRTLERHYGSQEEADVARVREVYEELGVREAFTRYEEEFHSSIMARIEGVESLPPALFTLFLGRVYKRTK